MPGSGMTILTVVPTRIELNAFLKACLAQGYHPEPLVVDGISSTYFPGLATTVALGGLGKIRFMLQTQHLIAEGDWDLVICAGAAGALVPGITTGDVVVATETVDYDIRDNYVSPQLSRFRTSEGILDKFRQALQFGSTFRVYYGPIACTDVFFIAGNQRIALQKRTDALVVAMEGAGGARACQIKGIPFIEIRVVTDQANILSLFDFLLHLNMAMKNLAQVVISLSSGVAANSISR
jgi:adenosylhomocysteine nucleosidase